MIGGHHRIDEFARLTDDRVSYEFDGRHGALGRFHVAGTAGVADDDGEKAKVGTALTVDSMPISASTPQIAKLDRKRSGRLIESSVPWEAEKMILSRIA